MIRPTWVADEDALNCSGCEWRFHWMRRRHHCRSCGEVFCSSCSKEADPLPWIGYHEPVRVCDSCHEGANELAVHWQSCVNLSKFAKDAK